MIWIEKESKEVKVFTLWIGELQHYPMQMEDLKDLETCIRESLALGEEGSPKTNFRILNPVQYSEEFTDDRFTLWVGQKKWHIRENEITLLIENLSKLIQPD